MGKETIRPAITPPNTTAREGASKKLPRLPQMNPMGVGGVVVGSAFWKTIPKIIMTIPSSQPITDIKSIAV